MAVNTLSTLIANDSILLPWLQMAASQLVQKNYAMPSRVLHMTDLMGSWQVRQNSEYVQTGRAKTLAESTAIPASQIMRAHLNQTVIKEVGDSYQISERRLGTDPENLLNDVAISLAKSVGERLESDLFQAANSSFTIGVDKSSSDFSVALLVASASLMQQYFNGVTMMHNVIHPYQALPVLEQLVTHTDAQSGAYAIQNARVSPAQVFSHNLVGEVVTSTMHPRNVVLKLGVAAASGTFRLQVGSDYVEGENITAAITYSSTVGTLVTNIQTALNNLDMSGFYSGAGTWAVTGSDEEDLTITPPSDLFLDDFSQLRIANKYDSDAVINPMFDSITQKSAYDLLATPATGVYDMNNNQVGVYVRERSATARAYTFFQDALVWDERKAFTMASDLTLHQERTSEYSIATSYYAGSWRPYKGMYTTTKANSPVAVGS